MKINNKKKFFIKGQIMIVVVLALGGIMIGATVIGGILTTNQLKQARNIFNSAKAIYAADAALGWGLYQYYLGRIGRSNVRGPSFSNGATSTTWCLDGGGNMVSCDAASVVSIIGKGSAGEVSRALKMSF